MKQPVTGENDIPHTLAPTRLSGWLSVCDENENNQNMILPGYCPIDIIQNGDKKENIRKNGSENVVWKLKGVSFCPKTKKLSFTAVPGDEQENILDSPLKSPGTELALISPKGNENFFNNRSYSTTRGRVDSQQTSSFKQFFSRKLAISRTRSVGKLGTQKNEAASPKSSNALWGSWRSADSDYSLDDELEASINLSDPELSIIRPIHPSVFFRSYCFQVLTPFDRKYFSCCTEVEYNMWLHGLHSVIHSTRNQRIRLDTSLSVWIIEAKGIPLRKRYFCELFLDKILFARTSVKYKNDMLFWGEQFHFDDLPPTEAVTISLFRESDTKKKRRQDKSLFVGSSVIDLINLETNTEIEKWVSVYIPGISPKMQQKTAVNNKTEQAFIRAKLKYETTVVLPITSYTKLHEFVKTNYLTLTNALESSINLKTKDLLAQTLLKILHASDCAETFLVDVIMNEVGNTTNENLTFRGNSLATKSIDTYMKMIGKNYLQETLGNFITSVYEYEDDAEVDPQKLTSPSATLGDNQKNLVRLVEDAWKSIFLSIEKFPRNLQIIFSMVRKRCEEIERDIVKKIVSASLFLRLLCPAILSPSLFQLTQEYPNEKVARTLTLIAKTIQNLANFTRFGSKEGYMEILNEFVEREMTNMDNFLQAISYAPSTRESDNSNFSVCKNIDLARELSVLYHLMVRETAKLSEGNTTKLNELIPILEKITKIHEDSPKPDELRLSRPFATVASVCRKPLPTPTSGLSTPLSTSTPGGLTPSSIIVENTEYDEDILDCYMDTLLSVSEDYVSGCSLVNHRSASSRTSSNRSKSRTEGRAEQKKYAQNRTTSDYHTHKKDHCKRSQSVGDVIGSNATRVFENKGKFDKLLSVSSQATINRQQSKGVKSEPTLTGFKKRHSLDQQSPARKGSRDTGSVKDRISMFSQKNSPPSKLPVHTRLSSPISSHSPSTVMSPCTPLSPSTPRAVGTPITPGKPGVARKPSKRHSEHIPVLRKQQTELGSKPKSVVNPPLAKKPVVSKKPVLLKNVSDKNKVIEKNNNQEDEQTKLFNRESLKLTDLRKEHQFDECKSPELLTYHSSPKRTVLVPNQSNGINFDDNLQKKVEPVTKENFSNREQTEKTPSFHLTLHRKSLAREVAKGFESNDEVFDKPPAKVKMETAVEQSRLQRHHSEVTSHEIKKKNWNQDSAVTRSTEITRLHSNGYCEILHEGIIEHSNSFMSSCSSNYTCSSDSYYSDDDEITSSSIYVEGDNISDVLTEEVEDDGFRDDGYTHSTLGSRSNRRPPSSSQYNHDTLESTSSRRNSSRYSTLESNVSRRHSSNTSMYGQRQNSFTSNQSTQRNGFDSIDDPDALKQKLRETESLLRKTQHELKSRTTNFEQTVIHLKEKLMEGDKKMKAQRVETDSQMKNVISRLLNVESELRTEHTEMEAIIKGKQNIIDVQERRIKSLEESNARLVDSLTSIRNKYTHTDVVDEDDRDQLTESEVTNESETNMNRVARQV